MSKGIEKNKIKDIINNLETDEKNQYLCIKYRIFDAKDEEIFEGTKEEFIKCDLLNMYVNQYEEVEEINNCLLVNIYLDEVE